MHHGDIVIAAALRFCNPAVRVRLPVSPPCLGSSEVERPVEARRVAGSTPAPRTTVRWSMGTMFGCLPNETGSSPVRIAIALSSNGRTPASQAGSRGSVPRRATTSLHPPHGLVEFPFPGDPERNRVRYPEGRLIPGVRASSASVVVRLIAISGNSFAHVQVAK